MDHKQILVVCSSPNGQDITIPKNIRLRALLFGSNPIYMFCDGYKGEGSFPTCPPDNDANKNRFDFIWFAGCNFFQSIFKSNAIEKIYNILKPNGHILFTESEYIKNGRRIDYEPTLDDYDDVSKSALIKHIRLHGKEELDRGNWKNVAEKMFVTLTEDTPSHNFDEEEKKQFIDLVVRNLHDWYNKYKLEQDCPPNLTVTLENIISHSEHMLPDTYNPDMATRVLDCFYRNDLHNDFIAYKIKSISKGGNIKKSKKYKRKNKHYSVICIKKKKLCRIR
jgi:hypothetical protein